VTHILFHSNVILFVFQQPLLVNRKNCLKSTLTENNAM